MQTIKSVFVVVAFSFASFVISEATMAQGFYQFQQGQNQKANVQASRGGREFARSRSAQQVQRGKQVRHTARPQIKPQPYVNQNPLFIDPFLAAQIQRQLAIEAILRRQRQLGPDFISSGSGRGSRSSASIFVQQSPTGSQPSFRGSSSTREVVTASPAKRIASPFASFSDDAEVDQETQYGRARYSAGRFQQEKE